MKSKDNNQGVKTGAAPQPASSSSSNVCPKNTPPGASGASTGGNGDQIPSGVSSQHSTPGPIKNVGQNITTDSDSNSDNHCGTGGIGGGTLTAPHSVGSSVSGGDRGTPIGTPGIGHPARYYILVYECLVV